MWIPVCVCTSVFENLQGYVVDVHVLLLCRFSCAGALTVWKESRPCLVLAMDAGYCIIRVHQNRQRPLHVMPLRQATRAAARQLRWARAWDKGFTHIGYS